MYSLKVRPLPNQKFIKKVTRVLWFAPAAVLACLLVALGVLLATSPGRMEPFLDESGRVLPGSVSEKIKVRIGGLEQGMILRGSSDRNPVLLFLHGGPGMPEYFLMEKYAKGLEDRFTVCYWEQRGAGLSHSPGIEADAITTERLVSDTIEVAGYLRQRFGQEKITLMAHSWGSYLGILAAAKAPELFRAYVGVAQVSNLAESERLAYRYMLGRYEAEGNQGRLDQMRQYDVLGSDRELRRFFISMLRDETMHELGIGTMRSMDSVLTGIFLPVMGCKAYTVGEKFTVWKAKAFLRGETALLDELVATDLAKQAPELGVPAYFLCGAHDYTVNYGLSRAYFDQLEAPVKGFYTFDESAHSPMCEEPERFMEIMTGDVLAGTAELADKE